MDLILSRAKAVVVAIVVAILAALAGLDWQEIVGGAIASGLAVERTPNKKR